MTDRSSRPDSTNVVRDEAGTPRWVKAFGIIMVVLILLFVLMHLAGRGFSGHALP